MEQLKSDYGDEIRVVYRHLPLITIHDKAQVAAEAAEAAGAQDKFWEMHDLLFARQPEWAATPEAEIIDVFVAYAEEIGLEEVEKFRADLENDIYADKVLADYNAATEAKVGSTPSFVMNGINYPAQELGFGYEGLDLFIKLVNLQIHWVEQPEQVLDSQKEYVATIETEKGNIVIELYHDTAPVNVNSFAFLAQQGWYDNSTFHRVLQGFMAQGGDPTGTGIGFPGYRCGDEIVASRSFDQAGVVSLANSGSNTNGGQFFITFGPTPNLNEGFTIIGQVIEGMDVVESITFRDPQNNPTTAGDTIVTVTVDEKE